MTVLKIERLPHNKFLPEYKREMLVFYTVPEHAGELLVVQCNNTMNNVSFNNGMYFKDLGEVYRYYSKIIV